MRKIYHKKKEEIDEKAFSKRYRTNVKKIITAWKKGYSDMEISKFTGLDLPTLQRIKTDIELTHRRIRLEKRKSNLKENNIAQKKNHIFLNPFI